MKISYEEAVKIAIEKYGTKHVFVGNLEEVWDEERRVCKRNNLPEPTYIDPERLTRLDGTEWNIDTDDWSQMSKTFENEKNNYYYVLLPEIPKQAKDKINKIDQIESYILKNFPYKFWDIDVVEILKLFKKGGFKMELTKEELSEKMIDDYNFLMR